MQLFINALVLWKGQSMAAIVTIGIDLAKNVFAVHVGDFGAESQVLAVSDCTSVPCRRITAAATAAPARSST